jgi:hypothetical protein
MIQEVSFYGSLSSTLHLNDFLRFTQTPIF